MKATVREHVAQQSEIIVTTDGPVRVITLNRPEALNALTLGMVRTLRIVLDEFDRDPNVECILLTGAGDRGLCAGGDVRTLYHSCLEKDRWAETFLAEEYALNARISSYRKPFVAIMDGFVMGGGVGVSAHARYRVVTGRSKVAMPEVGIGLIPDVGGTWLLSRGPGETGTYLALTGVTINAADAIYVGLADFHVEASRLSALTSALSKMPAGLTNTATANVIQSFQSVAASGLLHVHRALIDTCFAHQSVEAILAALAKAQQPFADATAATMLAKSPTSLKVTLKLLRLARSAPSLEDCLKREYAAILEATRGPDPVEGIRAAVIDKDRKPRWKPARLEDVGDADIEAFLNAKPRMSIPFHIEDEGA